MKKTLVLVAVAIGLGVCSAHGQEASRRAMAESLLNAMNVQDTIEKSFAMLQQMIPAQMDKMKQAAGQTNTSSNVSSQTAKMMDMMAQEFSWSKVKNDYITLYADTFTEEEMKGILGFYNSPAGQAFVKKQPELMKRSMELSQKIMMQVMPKIQAMAEEMEATPATGAKEK